MRYCFSSELFKLSWDCRVFLVVVEVFGLRIVFIGFFGVVCNNKKIIVLIVYNISGVNSKWINI